MLIGNAVVGQSGGPTAAINATLSGVIRGALASPAIETVYGMRNGMEGLLEKRLTALNDIFADEANLRLLEQTPAAALGSCRKKLPSPTSDKPEDIALFYRVLRTINQNLTEHTALSEGKGEDA